MMRKFSPTLTQLRYYISQSAATLVGCVLFAIGLTGTMGMDLYPIASISFLTQHTALGAEFDQLYWTGLALVGILLILFIGVRLVAIAALLLVAAKWAILHGLLPF